MRPVREARWVGRSARGLRFDCDAGIECRVCVLLPDLVRVLFVRTPLPAPPSSSSSSSATSSSPSADVTSNSSAATRFSALGEPKIESDREDNEGTDRQWDQLVRQPRTWMVPAYGADDVPWEGRDRMDMSSWPHVPYAVEQVHKKKTEATTMRKEDAHRVEGRVGDDELVLKAVLLTTSALRLKVTLTPSFRLEWSTLAMPAAAADSSKAHPEGVVCAKDRAKHAYMFGARGALRHACERGERDAFYGLGDKTGALDLHGRRLRTTMLDSLGVDPEKGDPMYKHWPFLIARNGETGAACGFLYDNMAAATFDLGCERDNYYGPYRSYEAESGDLDYYVFPGPDSASVTRKFLELTGRPALPPRWTLGYAQTAMALADSPNAQERIEEFIKQCTNEKMPVSAFHFGSGYTMIGPRRYVFNWNRDKFPEPERLMRLFHEAGMHVVANVKPCLLDDHPRYSEPLSQGAFVKEFTGGPAISQFWDGEGAHLDFTNSAAIAWWQQGLREQVLAKGMDVAWNDNNEYGFWNEDAVCNGFGTPIALDLARPLQSLLMTRASLEEQRRHKSNERQFVISRAGCPGIQRYAQTWSGDNTSNWRSLKWNLRTCLTMSMSGLINTSNDIGGFAGPIPEAELLIRWTQANLLHPRLIMNSWKPNGLFNSPWLHSEATPAIRDALTLRYRLIPYLYSLMHHATQGSLVLQPTFFTFECDPKTFVESDEFMVGPYLLCAPVVEPGQRARTTYLPRGPDCWFDFWTEEKLAAGSQATLAAPLDRLPLVVPSGAIIPMTHSSDTCAALHDEPSRLLRIFPGTGTGTSEFVLIEDDGISVNAATTRVVFNLSWTEEQITLRVRTEGNYILPFDRIAVQPPRADRRKVLLDGAPGVPTLIELLPI